MSITGARPMGEHAVLLDCSDLATVHRLQAALRADRLGPWTDVVAGWDTVLVRVDPAQAGALDRLVDELCPHPGDRPAESRDLRGLLPDDHGGGTESLELHVRYDGADLPEVAALTGLTVGAVIARHTAPTYTVGMVGFAPGFGYLTGLDPALQVPRLATPRASVPAGSVAIAGPQTAVYPHATPGGWRLLGHTDAVLFDAAREPAALLAPGMRVRFRAAS